MASKLISLQGFKPTTRPPNNQFAAFLKATCPEKSTKTMVCFIGFEYCVYLSPLPLCTPNSSLPSPRPASRCPPGPPKTGQGRPRWPKMSPRWAQKGTSIHDKILQDNFGRRLVPILGPTSANLFSTWTQPGPSKPILKPTWHPSCSWQGFKPTARPPNNQFAAFLKATCPEKSAKTIGFP